jgi:hypothetical protein
LTLLSDEACTSSIVTSISIRIGSDGHERVWGRAATVSSRAKLVDTFVDGSVVSNQQQMLESRSEFPMQRI